ncbi:sodium:solute symporter family protein [Sinomonas sp. ASV322]|uniref:sodium:solute symporter family protein n=1 Tax=Sinomonas sp. ASV322 TaxID=3041920 RepID=UPI0027DE002D|nr:sodium:solute symporter family protein [Sinomonas sp. ASV322]MDQ4504567.1 sodium:solute symporter family protein [Sinomonas sp. ASV322]
MIVGYGGVIAALAVVVLAMELSKRKTASFSDYATGGRSFGPFFATMAFLNTWLPGAVFVAFGGLTVSAGLLGFQGLFYSLLAVILMFLLARPVHEWGRAFDLRTQADLLGLRYNSRAVRVVSAVIGIAASFPWLVMGMQSLTLVFEYLSFGAVDAIGAVVVGILVVAVRQIWTMRFGMRGVMISDMVQGLLAYGLGFVLVLGFGTWLVTNGHGFGAVQPALYGLPGPDSAAGGLYVFSLVLTGTLGGWCWPDIFVRLFTARSTATIQRSAVQAAPALLVFSGALTVMTLLASSMPDVASAPDHVWFLVARHLGPVALTLAGICVVMATMGNVSANLQALGTQTVNDILGVARGEKVETPRAGRIAVAVFTVAAAGCALALAGAQAGLFVLAMISYQGICQLAPTLFFGIFWQRGNAIGAVASMIVGLTAAAVLQMSYPLSIPWLGGLTSGAAALVLNAAVYIVCAYAFPGSAEERARIDGLFDRLRVPRRRPLVEPAFD